MNSFCVIFVGAKKKKKSPNRSRYWYRTRRRFFSDRPIDLCIGNSHLTISSGMPMRDGTRHCFEPDQFYKTESCV